MSIRLEETVNFRGPDWMSIKAKLIADLQNSYDLIANITCDNDSTQQLRGKILYIKSILAAENTALNTPR